MTVDAANRAMDEEIAAARDALLATAAGASDRWWTARELKTRARNGWSSSAMALALAELVEQGALEKRRDFRVRLRS